MFNVIGDSFRQPCTAEAASLFATGTAEAVKIHCLCSTETVQRCATEAFI